MFKVSKRKRNLSRPLKLEVSPPTSSDDEKESNITNIPTAKRETSSSNKIKTQKNRIKQWGLSFEDAAADNDDGKFQKSKKGGMGFGGQKAKEEHDDDNEEEQLFSHEGEKYGRQHLDQLKSDQRRYVIPTATTSADAAISSTHGQDDLLQRQTIDEKQEEDLVSMSPVIQETVVAGDEAFEYVEQQIQTQHETATVESDHIDEDEQEHQEEWEAQVASRGGGYYTNKKSQVSSYSSKGDASLTTLDDMLSTFQNTIQKLQNSKNETSSKIQRLTVEKQSLETLIREKSLCTVELQTSLSYYQALLHNKLSPLIHKLRSLQEKVQLIHDKSHTVAKLRLDTKRRWEEELINDSYSLTAIKDSDTAMLQQIPLVDEFGREIGDDYKERQREDRWKQRIASWNQAIPNIMIDTSPADILSHGVALFNKSHLLYQKDSISDETLLPLSSSSTSSLDDRIQALVDALLIIEASIIDDYELSITSIANIFYEWQATDKYKEEYNNCYASEIFIDLISVLVKAEWISFYVAQFLKKAENNNLCDLSLSFKWYSGLKNHLITTSTGAKQQHGSIDTNSNYAILTAKIVRRTILSDFLSILKDEYDPSCDRESQWLSSVYLFICECLSASEEDSQQIAQVGDCVFSSLQLHADNIYVPRGLTRNGEDSKCFTAIGSQLISASQLLQLQHLATNICKFWMPSFITAGSRGKIDMTMLISRTASLLRNVIVDRLMNDLDDYLNDTNGGGFAVARAFLRDTMDAVKFVTDLVHIDDRYKELILWAAPLNAALGFSP